MADSDLDEALRANGYAKVIVSIRKDTTLAAASATSAESSIEGHFMMPSEAQAESLALVAGRVASRHVSRVAEAKRRRVRVYPHLGLAIGFADTRGIASLRTDPQVDKVVNAAEPSLIRPVEVKAAKLSVSTSWGIRRLNIKPLWDAGFTGRGVVVGHLDTGVDGRHPALKGAIHAFAEFDMLGERVPNAKPTDSGDHGTHTAGTIVGRAGSNGSFGVAPDAKLASAMVIEGGQVIDRILGGLDWIVEQQVRIMSMSLGLRGYTPAFEVLIAALRSANVLPIIAVGNEFPNTSRSPGNYDNVLSVGAMNEVDKVADFSGSQRFNRPTDPLVPDLVAPGVDILSCVPGKRYEKMSGSSMATPHVAGLAALLLQAKPDATAVQLETAILQSCSLVSSMPAARANRGVPDAVKAYSLLTGQSLPAAKTKSKGGKKKVTVKKAAGKKKAAKKKHA
jgi:subtilisin